MARIRKSKRQYSKPTITQPSPVPGARKSPFSGREIRNLMAAPDSPGAAKPYRGRKSKPVRGDGEITDLRTSPSPRVKRRHPHAKMVGQYKVNMTGNARSGQLYRDIYTTGGNVIHDYKRGPDVMVKGRKPSKKRNYF